MPEFNRSVTAPLPFKPKHIVSAVLQEGAFVLVDEAIYQELRAKLIPPEKIELDTMVVRWAINDADVLKRPQTWGCPCWAGQSTCVYIQIPQALMNGPSAVVPAKVSRFFDRYYA